MSCCLSAAGQFPLASLSTGYWYKLSVASNGIYKIDYDLFQKMGFDVTRIDPKKIRLFTAGNGMLPQANAALRQGTLREMAIRVSGEEDGRFDKSDVILFYGRGPDAIEFDLTRNIFHYENNLYSDRNFYFLTVGPDDGLRPAQAEDLSGTYTTITEFDDFAFYETDQRNILHSGREWFGEQLDLVTEIGIQFDIPGMLENSEIKVASQVMAQSFDQSSFKLFLNGVSIGEQLVDPIPNSQYGIKGRLATDTFKINTQSTGSAGRTNQELKYQYIKNASGKSIGYLDKVLLSFSRNLRLEGDQVIFSSARSLMNPVSTYQAGNAPTDAVVWNVSDPYAVKEQNHRWSDNVIIFSAESPTLNTFIIARPEKLPAPFAEGAVPNQNLHGLPAADLLIVTYPSYKEEAVRLAAHRAGHTGITAMVVTTDEIYNEFSGGKQDVTAIRDFARYFYLSHPGVLKNLLLFGRCSYDYKDRILENTNFVPTYESRNSLSPLETYSSDDYFGFFDDDEGEWKENPAQNHTLEIGIGRLSIKNKQEAADVVDKLIAYDIGKNSFGKWRKEILFVADDGDFNIHQGQADQLATDIETGHPAFDVQKLYLDSYPQESKPGGQVSPAAKEALRMALKKGVLITNFTGHGSEQVWMQEQILDPEFIANWKNFASYPLMITATCEFGRHDDPQQISSGERAQVKKEGGAIGLVTTARPVNSSTNFTLNKAFYQSLFEKPDGTFKDLGTIFKDTKNYSLSGVANRNFSLLGDPSMKLALPEQEITITNINTVDNSDTLKALSKVLVAGQIMNGSAVNTSFNGTLNATIFDKQASVVTLGDENSPFVYADWNNALFRGDASVNSGTFEFDLLLPKNLDPEVGMGKISLYALDPGEKLDAIGSSTNFKVGLLETNVEGDTDAPVIKLFMGDTTFIAEGTVSSNTQLVAQLSDKSGLNISRYVAENRMTAILDESTSYEVSDYFNAAKDDFTRGTIIFPLEGLARGRHTITLKAWDNFNNPGSATLIFYVSDTPGIVVEELINFPNPFNDKTTIQFSHSHPGEDLEAIVTIYTPAGAMAQRLEFMIPESQYQVTLAEWDGSSTDGTKLGAGIYIMRVSVRSLLDGSKNEQIAKIIILN